jgi:hypothetical protein
VTTPAQVGKNRHRGLVVDARLVNERVRAALDDLVEEMRAQGRQARPSLDRLALLTAQVATLVGREQKLLDEMHELLAAWRNQPDEDVWTALTELRERVERLECSTKK